MLAIIKHFVDDNIIYLSVASTTNLKKSSSDCLNSGKAVIQHLCEKMRCSFFRVLPGIAEALRR